MNWKYWFTDIELGLYNTEKTSGRPHCSPWDLIATLQHLEGAYEEEGDGLFIWSDSDKKRGNGFKLKG